MQVSITGRHVELTDALKQYVEEKLQHLKHSFDQVVAVHVVLSVEKFRHRCEVTIQANRLNIHASHETDDMYASIDGVVDKLNRQLKRYRAKMRKHQAANKSNSGGMGTTIGSQPESSRAAPATACEWQTIASARRNTVLASKRANGNHSCGTTL